MKILFSLLALLVLPGFVQAQDGVPDLSNCEAWLAHDGPEFITLMVTPDRQGPSFTEAKMPNGLTVDGTIYLHVLDWNDVPIPNFPAEDMWIESFDGGLVPCSYGACADVDTDQDGMTHWINPIAAGGHSQDLTQVFISGDTMGTEPLRLNFNSPDINGDGVVSLADISYFATDFYGDFNFRSDLFRDGMLNISDLGRLATGFGAGCP